jgi:hypothetical protein
MNARQWRVCIVSPLAQKALLKIKTDLLSLFAVTLVHGLCSKDMTEEFWKLLNLHAAIGCDVISVHGPGSGGRRMLDRRRPLCRRRSRN